MLATTFSQPGSGHLVVDDNCHSNGWYIHTASADARACVAIQLAQGPTRLFPSWDDALLVAVADDGQPSQRHGPRSMNAAWTAAMRGVYPA
jgi:hypothetical protein